MKEINAICKKIMKLTPDHFTEADKIIDEQQSYSHPLKGGTAGKINKKGDRNKRVIAAFKELYVQLNTPE